MVGGFESRSIASTAIVLVWIVQLTLGSDELILAFDAVGDWHAFFFFFPFLVNGNGRRWGWRCG